MKKFEYESVYVYTGSGGEQPNGSHLPSKGTLPMQLQPYGKDGWQVVWIERASKMGHGFNVLLMKEIQEEPNE